MDGSVQEWVRPWTVAACLESWPQSLLEGTVRSGKNHFICSLALCSSLPRAGLRGDKKRVQQQLYLYIFIYLWRGPGVGASPG